MTIAALTLCLNMLYAHETDAMQRVDLAQEKTLMVKIDLVTYELMLARRKEIR